MQLIFEDYVVELTHLPKRKKPIVALMSKRDGYLAHAVVRDERAYGEFVRFFEWIGKEFC